MQEYIKIHSNDNVAVALADIAKGRVISVDGLEVEAIEDIPRGHKIALSDISAQADVIKYGFPIGHATEDIKKGSHVHVQNLKTNLGDDLTYEYHPNYPDENMEKAVADKIAEDKRYFMGYERKDGRAGVRNELWVLPTVGCVNANAKAIANRCQDMVCENIEAVIAYAHPYGCSQMGDDQENTREALASLVHHPNVGGVLVLGLGCENSNIEVLKEYIGEYDETRVRFLQCQDVEDEIEEGIKLMKELCDNAKKVKRTKISVDKLVIGLKCGGSDGLSGITANPTVGRFSDYLISVGGTTILTEVPEMFGAETILMDRCENKETFEKTVHLINDFKDYFRFHNQTIYENPSPGNKKGGISSLEDKALGCTQKSGSFKVVDVLKYGKKHEKAGLNLLSAPGNDLVASTALAISGAQIVLFTTGRGTPFATAVPTMKISTNTPLFEKKNGWIDFDCGRLLNEGTDLDMLGMELYERVLKIASGELVKSEKEGFRDLAIFKQGVTL